MMTDIHKQRDTYEHILEGKHHIWPSFFFFLEEKHQRIDTCTVFFFFFHVPDSERPSKRLERTS